MPESTVAQRIVRAKRTLSEAHVPFEAPTGREREAAPTRNERVRELLLAKRRFA